MKKYIGTVVGILFFVGLIALATNLSSSDSEIDFFADEDGHNNGIFSIQFPSMNITSDTLRNWTGEYWNYTQYAFWYVHVKNVSVTSNHVGSGYYYTNVKIIYDARGNYSSLSDWMTIAEDLSAEALISGPNGYVSVSNLSGFTSISSYDMAEFLRLYCKYVIQLRLDSIYYANQTSNSSSNTTSNYSNSTNASNYTNETRWAEPEPMYGPVDFVLSLPSRNITRGNMSIYVYNATFYGNSTSSYDYKGRIYAQFNMNAVVSNGWYPYFIAFYEQDIVYELHSRYSASEYFNHSLLPGEDMGGILFMYLDYANSAIISAIGNSSSNSSSSNTTNTTTQYLPYAYMTAENLTTWYNTSWWVFDNLTSYVVSVYNANFTGTVENSYVNGKIQLTFEAFGNDTYSPWYNKSKIWEFGVGATIEVTNSWVSLISFHRSLSIAQSDLEMFLRAWIRYSVVPYLLNNSSNTTTGIQFPEYNITGYDLASWNRQYSYVNYTWPGYYVYLYNFNSSLRKYDNYVSGTVNFSFIAYGNDSYDPCYYGWCNRTTVYSNGSMYVYMDDCSEPYAGIYPNYGLRINESDISNFLRGYFYAVMAPNIATYYNLTTKNTTNTTTQYLPSAYMTAENLTAWYSTAWWVFDNFTSYRVNVYDVNFTGTNNTFVNGTIRTTLSAFGNDTYSPWYNKSKIWEYNVGVTIDVYSNDAYNIYFDRSLSIDLSDLQIFLRAWIRYSVVPYLLNNSSNTTTGIQFPERNITGWDLNDMLRPNFYANYTWSGYYVSVYNFAPFLEKNGNNVSGAVNFSFVAFGNDTYYPCYPGYYTYCNQTTVYSNTTMYIYMSGDRANDSIPYFYLDWNLRVNSSDISNFLRGYYYAVMLPTIISYYNLTTGNSTANRTIYLPNYYNDSQINIDCSSQPWYCSGAHSQSNLFFTRAVGYNLSITVNDRGDGYFNGMLNLPYMANLINFTSTYYGKETIVSNLQGNATLYLWGQVSGTGYDSYYVTLNSNSYANVVFDRNNFVQKAAQQAYSDRFMWQIQGFVNNILSISNGTTHYRYY